MVKICKGWVKIRKLFEIMNESGTPVQCESFEDWRNKIGSSNALNPLSFYFDKGFPLTQTCLIDKTMEEAMPSLTDNYFSLLCKQVSE